jgi:acetyl-CoA synthetase
MYECKYVEQLDSSFCTNVFEKMYFQNDVFMTGDAASYDDDNSNIKVMGRLDDVLNISGHRLGTTEFEDAINGLDEVVESAVIGIRHAIKGQAVFVYVVAKRQDADYREIARQIVHSVKMHIGPIAKPDFIAFINAMPKNNSGKIVRSVLKRIANREECTESDFISVTNRCIVKALQNAVNNAMECPDSCFMEPSI